MPSDSFTEEKIENDILGLHEKVVAITRDYVRSLSRSKAKLGEHAVVLSAILESIGVGLLVVSPERKVLLVNDALVKLARGETAESLKELLPNLRLAGYEVYQSDGITPQEESDQLVTLAMAKREVVESELYVRGGSLPKEGIWLRATAAPIIKEDGTLLGAVAIYHDVTVHKEALNRITDLYNNAPCGYQSLDSTGTILEANKAQLATLGCTRVETIGRRRFQEFLTEKSRETFHDNFSRLKEMQSLSQVQLEVSNGQGEIRTVLWNSDPIASKEGSFQGSRCTIFDITESKNLELQRDALAAIITHDIKNHVVGEAGCLEMLFPEDRTGMSRDEESLVKAMKLANVQYINLTNDLLYLYKMESDGYLYSPGETNLEELVKEVVTENSVASRMRNVGVLVDSRLPSGYKLKCDPFALARALHNLLHNALRFSPEGGSVHIRLSQAAMQATIEVSDEGPGMDEHEIGSLFEPIWRRPAKAATQASSQLGLYLTHLIVKAHSGKITVRSEPGVGTTFSIHLPLL